jgi:hypothetical protein
MSGKGRSLLLALCLLYTGIISKHVTAQLAETKATQQTPPPHAEPLPKAAEADGNIIRLCYRLIECPDRAVFAGLEKNGDNQPNTKGQIQIGVQFLSAKEQAKLLETVQANKRTVMVTSPRVTLASGTSAKVSIGSPSKGVTNKDVAKRMNIDGLNLETKATLNDGVILIESKGDFLHKDQSHYQWETAGKLKSGESMAFSGTQSKTGNPSILVIITAETLP